MAGLQVVNTALTCL